MCGRFTLASPAETINGSFGPFDAGGDDEIPELAPRYNIAPTETIVAVRATPEGGRRLEARRWGLVPRFAREIAGPPLFNARSETAAEKPAFRDALRRRRCVIPADGFFEWFSLADRRQPFHIRREDRAPFAMAGLFEDWRSPEGEAVASCTILTTRANPLLAPIHARMPVLIPADELTRWLDPDATEPAEFTRLFEPAPDEGWTKYPVDPCVNRSSHDDPRNIEPLFDLDEAP